MSYEKSFIEVQFPVSKISKESYKERKAGSNQTLTGLGKWWGRKPLILVRAAIIGSLLPATDNPKKDREIFLKILSMDERGLELRKNKPISTKDLLAKASNKEKEFYFVKESEEYIAKYNKGITKEEKDKLQLSIFNKLSYDEKLKYCLRPEELKDTTAYDWKMINEHLGTNAQSLQGLVDELGVSKFGNKPRVGDCFAGGGSIPFEAGRIGCDVYASDLNPIAGLLTWSGLNLVNKSNAELNKIYKYLDVIFDRVVDIIEKLGVENARDLKAKYYLYCNEAECLECGCKVPLAPNWIINSPDKVIAELVVNRAEKVIDINIKEGATNDELLLAKKSGTVINGNMICPCCNNKIPIKTLRSNRDQGMLLWKNNQVVSKKENIFNERLYCIKYFKKFPEKKWSEIAKKPAAATDACYGNVYYKKPTVDDIINEKKVIEFVEKKIDTWLEKGYIPDSRIELGEETSRLQKERGWAYWSNLYSPRQLMINGLLMEQADNIVASKEEKVALLLAINSCANWNSKLCYWLAPRKGGGGASTFVNQALNTMFTYTVRPTLAIYSSWMLEINNSICEIKSHVSLKDARNVENECNLWITDPPYADAVNYHELSEFFLAWNKKIIENTFNDWYPDSKRILAVKGIGESFNKSMLEVYSNLRKYMSDDGMQIVMFTHSDVKVWGELAMILWSAGLQVTSAWNIATETESGGLKNGNYVKGTVLLVLRKQKSTETAYLDELYAEIEDEVKNQIDSMRDLDDKEDPNFSDPDYLLAAYAASLKVLTSYKNIEDIDVKYELSKSRDSKEESPIEGIINEAVKIAYDYLIPSEFDSFIWKSLKPEERLYLKGIEFEKQNLYQLSAYQELARGFGVSEYSTMLASTKANTARLKTPKEFAMKYLNDSSDFGSSLLRNVLVAVHLGLKEEDTSKGRNWLKTEVTNYWSKRSNIIEMLDYLSKLEYIDNMEQWRECSHEAFILKNLIENDNI